MCNLIWTCQVCQCGCDRQQPSPSSHRKKLVSNFLCVPNNFAGLSSCFWKQKQNVSQHDDTLTQSSRIKVLDVGATGGEPPVLSASPGRRAIGGRCQAPCSGVRSPALPGAAHGGSQSCRSGSKVVRRRRQWYGFTVYFIVEMHTDNITYLRTAGSLKPASPIRQVYERAQLVKKNRIVWWIISTLLLMWVV